MLVTVTDQSLLQSARWLSEPQYACTPVQKPHAPSMGFDALSVRLSHDSADVRFTVNLQQSVNVQIYGKCVLHSPNPPPPPTPSRALELISN